LTQQKSIADRRKLYEYRSQSNVEEKKSSPILMNRQDSLKCEKDQLDEVQKNNNHANGNSINGSAAKRTSTVFGKVSKYRHLKGTTAHKSRHIENLRNISRQIPTECDVFHANFERVAVPLSGNGGKIAVFELSATGRIADGVIPCLVNGNNIMDFQWDPFDTKRIAVACDVGNVKIWIIPETTGLIESTSTPNQELIAHSEKIYFIKFHPLAKNVLLTASFDFLIKIFDLSDMSEKICLKGHTDQIYSWCWSPCGQYGSSVCRDGKIRIYDPRKSDTPIKEGIGSPIGTRGARITYALGGEFLIVTGFDK
jgi:coronin-7